MSCTVENIDLSRCRVCTNNQACAMLGPLSMIDSELTSNLFWEGLVSLAGSEDKEEDKSPPTG